LQLLADDVAPCVNHPFRQMPIGQQLDFDLVKPSFAVLGFDIHHAQFIVQKFLVVVGIEDFRFGYRRSQIVNQYRGGNAPADCGFPPNRARL